MKKPDLEAATKQYFKNWETGEKDEMEARLANGFTYTSPRDDHIDGKTFLETRWPKAGKVTLKLERVHAVGPKDCIVQYEGKGEHDTTFRNMELVRFDGDRLLSVEVFFGRAPGETAEPPDETIRPLLEALVEAIKAKDVEKAMAPYAEDVIGFDLVQPLRNNGKAAVRERLQRWFESYEGAIESELRDLQIDASGRVAFAHGLQRFAGTMTNGTSVDMWVRVTWGLRRVNGNWQIHHQHMSDPMDPESGKMRLDLTP